MKNLAGLQPRFPRYRTETHLCGRPKEEAPHGNNRTGKAKPQKNIYETKPQQICGRFALRICGHYLLSYNVGNHAWTGRRTWESARRQKLARHFPATGGRWPEGTLRPCVGEPRVVRVSPFADDYTCTSLGAVPGLSNPYGGLQTSEYDDPNTLLIGGAAKGSAGRIYQVGVIRDANMHITGFSGTASVYPISQAAIGQFNEGGVAFGPQNVLFVTRYPVNQVEQSKVGSSAPDKVVDLSPLGVVASTGSIGFVPPGFPGAGSMKIVSFTGGGWYHADFVPDGSGTFDITAASLRANIVGGPEGIAFVPPGSPVFPSNSVLIALYGLGKVVTAPLDANGDPILANAQDVLQQLGHADGACIDP